MTDLSDLVNAIPEAQDGSLITPDYHNTILKTLKKLVEEVEGSRGGKSEDVTVTYAPAFTRLRDGENSIEWAVSAPGTASKPAGATSAGGWFNVQLPDGLLIKQLVVTGIRIGTVRRSLVVLKRRTLTDSKTDDLAIVRLQNVLGDPFTQESSFSVTGITDPAVLRNIQTVDNSQYQYFIQADITGAEGDATVDLTSIQIVCGF